LRYLCGGTKGCFYCRAGDVRPCSRGGQRLADRWRGSVFPVLLSVPRSADEHETGVPAQTQFLDSAKARGAVDSPFAVDRIAGGGRSGTCDRALSARHGARHVDVLDGGHAPGPCLERLSASGANGHVALHNSTRFLWVGNQRTHSTKASDLYIYNRECERESNSSASRAAILFAPCPA
jgi:hypothetical protein